MTDSADEPEEHEGTPDGATDP